jgi:hypothetical protein
MALAGRLRNIAIAREADGSKGTAVAASTGHFIGVDSGVVKAEAEHAQNNSSAGRIESGIENFVTKESSILSFSAPVKSDWIGHILVGLLGSVSSANASGETLTRDHTISVSNAAAAPAYTIFSLGGVADEKATYGTIRSLTLSCEAGGLLMADVEILAQALESATGTAAYSSDYHFQGSHGAIKLATALSGLGAASVINFHKLSITIERDVQPHHVFGSKEPNKFVPGSLKVTGSIELLHEAITYRDYFTDATERAMRIDFTNPTTIGSADNPELQINLAKCYFSGHETSEGVDDIVMETINFEAKYDLDEGTPQMIGVVLSNTEATTAYTTPA